jgi:electron transport complex protein RnfE
LNEASARKSERRVTDNPDLPLVLGICPLLGAVVSLLAGLGLGIASFAVVVAGSMAVAAMRTLLPDRARVRTALLLAAVVTTAVTVLFEAFLFEAWLALGVALPLVAINAGIVVQLAAVAPEQPPGAAARDAARLGTRILVWLALLGGARELLGQGTVLAGVEDVAGALAGLTLHLTPGERGFNLALAPAGGFFLLGLFVGARNWRAMRLGAAPNVR